MSHKSTIPLFLGLYFLLCTLTIYALFSGWAYDDPFITYRYAQNIAAGAGFVYNPGERILSTTTPLFAILLSFFSLFGFDLPPLANLIGAASLSLGAILLFQLAKVWNSPAAGWVMLILYPTFPLLSTTLGSETPLYLLFCIGAFLCYAREQYTLAAAMAALAILTRPDGVLVAGILGVHFLLRFLLPDRADHAAAQTRHIPWKAVLVFLALLAPWVIFSWTYFGSPLPVTLAAKQHQGEMAITEHFGPGIFTIFQPYALRWEYWLEVGLAVLGLFFALIRDRRWLLLFSWTVLYFVAYSILEVGRYFWYYAPLIPGFIAAVGSGIETLYRTFKERFPSTSSSRHELRIASIIIPFVLIAPLFYRQAFTLWRLHQQPDSRVAIYKAVGEWLNKNTEPGESAGMLEIGIIGYYSQRPVIDFAGLIQPEIATQFAENRHYKDAALWAVSRFDPDYLVLHNGHFTELETQYAATACNPVQSFSGEDYDYSVDMVVYTCR